MVFELVYGRSPSGVLHPSGLALLSIIFLAAVSDLMFRIVPNWLIFVGLMAALILSSSGNGFAGMGFMALGLVSGVVLFFPLYMVGLLGAGDVKLMGVVGAFLGVHQMLISSLLIFLMGGVISLIMLRKAVSTQQPPQVPYAVAIAGGVFLHLAVFS